MGYFTESFMRRILFLLPLFAVAGCATGPSLQSRMAGYTGASGQTLVQDLGVPDKQITVNGVEYLAYVRQRTTVSADPVFYGGFGGFGGPFWGPFGGGFYGGGFPPTVNQWSCETTFMLENNKVVNFTLRGNDCG
jgi:hypothetical protein